MRWIHRKSKWLHKYVGLTLLLFVVWMSASGIVLNHPELLRDLSVPRWLVPPQYRLRDWSRGALRSAVFSAADPRLGFIAGTQGVWKTTDGGRTFTRLADGFPSSWVGRQTTSLVLLETPWPRLIAGTRGGLYACRLSDERWQRVPLPVEEEEIRRLLPVHDDLVVFTPSHALRAPLAGEPLVPRPVEIRPATPQGPGIPLVRAIFDLHNGGIWGLPGRLVFDLVGLVMIFLSITAFYVWLWPWRRRRQKRRGVPAGPGGPGRYQWMLGYHLKLGIWLAALLLVIGSTGFFMRPPMIALVAEGTLPRLLYPAPVSDNPWHERIHSALWDEVADTLLIETTQGFWRGASDFSTPFTPVDPPGPVFVMGSNVLEPYGRGGYLVGSFSGLFHLERSTGRAIDLVHGGEAREVSRTRPAATMVAGFLRTPDGDEFAVSHDEGILPLGDARRDDRFAMPAAMDDEFRLPLWNFLFEIHNGRILRDLIGPLYAVVVPLGSLLFVLITLTGILDWCRRKLDWRAGS